MHSFFFWAGMINLLGSVQALILFLVLLNGKNSNKRAGILLAFICLALGGVIAGASLGALGYYKLAPHLIRIGDPLILAIPPLIYLFTKALLHHRYSRADFIHFVPFLVYVAMLTPFYISSGQEKIRMVEAIFHSEKASPQLVVVTVLRLIISGTYLVLSILMIPVKGETSSQQAIQQRWWRQVLFLCVGLTGLSLLLFLLFYMHLISFLEMNVWSGLVSSVMLYVITARKLSCRQISEQPSTGAALHIDTEIAEASTRHNTSEKYRSSALSAEETAQYGLAIQTLLEEKKPWLEPELTLNQLASALQIPDYILSQVINRHFGQSFYDLVNRYRVQEMIRLMNHPDKQSYTLLALAYEAGFNSKSTFNQVFKKFTGKTPSAFKTSAGG